MINLTKGFGDFEDYKLFKFPGGEIHFILKGQIVEEYLIQTRLNTSDDVITLGIVADTLHKRGAKYITAYIPYFPYAQADRDFAPNESFSLKTMMKWFNSLPIDKYMIFDPHSDVAPALLKNCEVLQNDFFIDWVGDEIRKTSNNGVLWLCPDSGAAKKIFKLAEKIGFKGEILCCQKDRNTSTGEVSVQVPTLPLKDILIIDDICVGGRTFTEIAKKIRKTEGRKLFLAISHGIFSNGFGELSQHFNNVFTTNSRSDKYNMGNVPEEFLKQYKII